MFGTATQPVLLTSWAKTTASVKGFSRKQVEEVARAAGFGLGNYTTRHTYPQQSTVNFHKIPPAHPRDSSGRGRSGAVGGKVAV